MNSTNETQYKAISARLRFVQTRVWNLENNNETHDINQKLQDLVNSLQDYFGPKIARELFWNVKEK